MSFKCDLKNLMKVDPRILASWT